MDPQLTDNSRVIFHLKHVGPLTCLSAIRLNVTYNLRSRISNLKKMGYKINSEMIQVRKANGRITRVAEYSIGALSD